MTDNDDIIDYIFYLVIVVSDVIVDVVIATVAPLFS